MPIAVEFYFDDAFCDRVGEIWQQMSAAGLGEWVRQIGTEPHLSLAVFDDDVDRDALMEVTGQFAHGFRSLELRFASIGVFPIQENIVFLSPTPTEHLLDVHRAYHTLLDLAGLSCRPYYVPDAWVPHCTIGAKLDPEQVGPTIELCQRHFDFPPAVCTALGIVEVPPVAELARWDLRPPRP